VNKLKVILILTALLTTSCYSGQKKNLTETQNIQRRVAGEATPAIDQGLEEWAEHSESGSKSNSVGESSRFVEYWIKQVIKDKAVFEKEFRRYLSVKLDYFAVVQNLVNEFDMTLDKNQKDNISTELYEMDDYILLQLIRGEFDETQNNFLYSYAYLEKVAHVDGYEERRIAASIIISLLKIFLQEKSSEYPVPIYTIASLLEEANERLEEDHLKFYRIDFKPFKIDDDKYKGLKKEPLNANLLDKKNKLKRRYKPKVEKYKKLMAKMDESRKPQSAYHFFPTAGTEGTMSGRTFGRGEWAITLDDGPSKYTTQFLANLKKDKTAEEIAKTGDERYTFFWVSKLITSYPKAVGEAAAKGCERASHSMTHANLSVSSEDTLKVEIDGAVKIFTEKIAPPTMFRCPYGACGADGRQRIADVNLIHIFWNVDSLDWQDKNPASVIERVRGQMRTQRRGIILFHDIHPQGVIASAQILQDIRASNGALKIVTVGDKIKQGDSNCNPTPNEKCFHTP
jgi:peptidoglycan/xylan/chitin deacetylase (PgdA/CDA1 family)